MTAVITLSLSQHKHNLKMPGGNRRLPRNARNYVLPNIPGILGDSSGNRYAPLGAAVPTLPVMEPPAAPKHFPFPNTPVDDDIFFETLMFAFTGIAGAMQFLNLYRTVFWLPHSYTKHAMNYYLIDLNLVAFITILLSRRLLYFLGCKVLEKFLMAKQLELAYTCYRFALFGIIMALLCCCTYYVILDNRHLNIMILCYPILLYLTLFGLEITSFFELVNWSSPTAAPPLHACRSTASEIRMEVENLKINFNNRIKQILFSTTLNGYYTGFIPFCFAPTTLLVDSVIVIQHLAFILSSNFMAYTTHILSLRYCDILHRSALHLGSWDKLETRSLLLVNNTWSEDMLWPYGALVKHGRDIYRAKGECNASVPGNTTFSRFYAIFRNPSNLFCVLLSLHIGVILFQLVCLVRSTLWFRTITLTFILFFNYYVLYKMARDYLVSSKMYDEERAMHNKISSHYFTLFIFTNYNNLNNFHLLGVMSIHIYI